MTSNVAELSAQSVLPDLATSYVGRTYYYFGALGSTQDEAAKAAAGGAAEGTGVVAHGQTGARGRFNRRWLAPPGSTLSFSLVLRPSTHMLPKIIMLSSLAVQRAIQRVTGLHAQIKWPNDVLVKEKKVCGILVETAFDGERPDYTIVGVGINVTLETHKYPEIAGTATSLSAELGHPTGRKELLLAVFEEMEHLYNAAKAGEPIPTWWRDHLVTLGRRVRVQLDEKTVVEGVAQDVDESGALYVTKDDGTTLTVLAGDVTLLK